MSAPSFHELALNNDVVQGLLEGYEDMMWPCLKGVYRSVGSPNARVYSFHIKAGMSSDKS